MTDESRSLRDLLARSASRRAFLAGSGLAIAAACSNGSDDSGDAEGNGDMNVDPGGDGQPAVQAALATQDLFAGGEDQRFAFGVLRRSEENTYSLVTGDAVQIAFSPPEGSLGDAQTAEFHGAGLPPDKGVYVARVSPEAPGFWEATITLGGESGTLPFEVLAEPLVPVPGDEAIAVTTPTVDDDQGVFELCTREPDCSFHDVPLDAALEAAGPVVIMFSTPRFCVSQVCGPVLDVLIGESEDFPDTTFIHSEIWANDATTEPVDAVTEWGLQTEPWLFGIKPDGTIAARLDGAFDQTEVRALIEATVA